MAPAATGKSTSAPARHSTLATAVLLQDIAARLNTIVVLFMDGMESSFPYLPCPTSSVQAWHNRNLLTQYSMSEFGLCDEAVKVTVTSDIPDPTPTPP
jgi:hypothetical protein